MVNIKLSAVFILVAAAVAPAAALPVSVHSSSSHDSLPPDPPPDPPPKDFLPHIKSLDHSLGIGYPPPSTPNNSKRKVSNSPEARKIATGKDVDEGPPVLPPLRVIGPLDVNFNAPPVSASHNLKDAANFKPEGVINTGHHSSSNSPPSVTQARALRVPKPLKSELHPTKLFKKKNKNLNGSPNQSGVPPVPQRPRHDTSLSQSGEDDVPPPVPSKDRATVPKPHQEKHTAELFRALGGQGQTGKHGQPTDVTLGEHSTSLGTTPPPQGIQVSICSIVFDIVTD